MPPRLTPLGRRPITLALLAGVMALGLSACGRRGQPEPPVDPAARPAPKAAATAPATRGRSAVAASGTPPAAAQPGPSATLTGDDDAEDGDDPQALTSPQPTPSSSRRKRPAYQVPKEPFFLDPLL